MTSPNLTSAADSVLDSPARKFPHVSSRHPVLYCVILLLIPLAAMVATLFIVRTSWFLLRSGNPYIATVGFGATLHNASCDVLIDGDSTAMVGIIPRIITQQTGLSSCNIAEFAGMEQVNGHLTLNQFLANNPRPKYIVFVYVPESLRSHEEWSPVSHFEAILYRLRTQPDAAFFHALLTHPGDTFSSWTLALRLAVLAPYQKPLSPEVLAQRSVNRGWFEVPGRVLDSCQMPESYTQPDATYIDSLRRQFGANGTRVLVDVIPEPDCEPGYSFFTPGLAATVDNQQQKFPISLYNNSGRLHLTPEGAERFSQQIATQINSQINHLDHAPAN